MKIGIIQRLRKRLFLKISLVFGIGLFIIVTAVFLAHGLIFLPGRFKQMRQNTVDHAIYMINDIHESGDLQKAGNIASKNKIKIRIHSPSREWASHPGMASFSDIQIPVFDEENKIRAGFTDMGFCIIIQKDETRYMVTPFSKREGFEYAAGLFLLAIIACATALLMGMYFLMRGQLQPIKTLSRGVKELSQGNLDYRMTTKRVDELGNLVLSFNQMTQRISEMIQARQQLLLDVSHELRSPLTRVKVALEFIEEKDTKKTIKEDITEVEAMITELLETERLNSPHGGLKKEEINLRVLIDDVSDEFKKGKPRIKWASAGPGEILINGDENRIRILFRNILDNALRYSHPDGYPVELSYREKTGEIIIAVQDFGGGIPEQDLPYIFEPFYRVDKSRSKETGGYGLGMSLCKKIMEAHDGSIEIVSKIEIGTTVFIKFKK